MKNIIINKRYNAYLKRQNHHQIWENNRLPMNKKQTEREREIYGKEKKSDIK